MTERERPETVDALLARMSGADQVAEGWRELARASGVFWLALIDDPEVEPHAPKIFTLFITAMFRAYREG